ncbi:MAG: aspartate aminotransferase family protein [Ignavibacteriae bacterium]|nr:aspartate aminotransferase family protein [Ignavibacteriota bacterium]
MDIAARESRYFFKTYNRLRLDIERGEGVHLFTKQGERYLDMFAGIAVNALGYNHPRVNSAIERQLKRYIHVSNTFYQDTQIELAERLIKLTGFARIFFTNSGTEALEGALKLARRWGRDARKTAIYGLTDSFHGRTLGSLSVSGRGKYRDGYEPFLPNTDLLAFNDVEELRQKVDQQTLAVVLEFVQGEGGVNLVSREYVLELARLREKYGFLIIADEIQTGVGRTGRFFAFDYFDIRPDIVVIAKALGGGLPLGAFMGEEKLSDVFTPGVHGSTFGGNPVACAAGIATLTELIDNGVMQNAEKMGGYLKGQLEMIRTSYPKYVADLRGLGLMIGVDLLVDGTKVVESLFEEKVLLNLTNNRTLRWLPPLIIRPEHVDYAVSRFEKVLRKIGTQ